MVIPTMITRQTLITFLQENCNQEFSKEDLINRFSNSQIHEIVIEKILSEIEVDFTYSKGELIATCKAGTVYFRWATP